MEAWQVTQEDVKVLLSSALASEHPNASELRARYRQVGYTGTLIVKECDKNSMKSCTFVLGNLLTWLIPDLR